MRLLFVSLPSDRGVVIIKLDPSSSAEFISFSCQIIPKIPTELG